MIILPAIDIKDGNCVRLFKGDFSTVFKVADDPYEVAQSFIDAGAEWMHMVDLDGAKDGIVRAQGWTDKSELNYLDLAVQMESIGVKTLIFTDIDQDGTLSGPNLSQLDKLSNRVSCDIIASGGVSNITDIINLKSLNLYGAITGKAVYTGDLDLADAIKIASKVQL